jgi:uncharacterized DUF497 family protein
MIEFEWDEAKNQANIAKHGISFVQAQKIFGGAVWSRVDQRMDYGETRLISVGMLEQAAIIVVVAHTERTGKMRIISARRANRKERRRYYEEIQRAAGT